MPKAVDEQIQDQSPQNVTQSQGNPLAIASFVIAILNIVLAFGIVAISGILEATTPGGIDETSSAAILVGLVVILVLFISLIGLGLGIAGTFGRRRQKVFAIVGLVIHAAILVSIIGLILLGLSISA